MRQSSQTTIEPPKELTTIREFLESSVHTPPSVIAVPSPGSGSGLSAMSVGGPPGVDLIGQVQNLRSGMMSPSSVSMSVDEQFRALTQTIQSPIGKIGKPGITPSPPTFQPVSSSLIGGGALEGLGGISAGYGSSAYSDFQNNTVKDLFQRSINPNAGVSPTSASLPGSLGGVPVPGLPLDPKVSGFNMPNTFNPLGNPIGLNSGRSQLQAAPPLGLGSNIPAFDLRQTQQQQDQESDIVRKRIDSLFKELFDQTITEDRFVNLVKQMKQDPGQQKEFKMLMRTLIQEFRNYSSFPTVHVERIAKVWGKILSEEILDGADQVSAQFLRQFLQRVCEALQNGMKGDDKLLLFGEAALQRFILGKPNGAQMLKKKQIYHAFCERIVDGKSLHSFRDKI